MLSTGYWLAKSTSGKAEEEETTDASALEVHKYWENYDPSQSLAPELVPREQYDAVRLLQRSVRMWLNIKLRVKRKKEKDQMMQVARIIRMQAIVRGRLQRKRYRRLRKEDRMRRREFRLFCQLLKDGFECWVYSKTYGVRKLKRVRADKKFDNLVWRPTALSSVKVPLRSIYGVERRHQYKNYKDDPLNPNLCFSILSSVKIVDMEATSSEELSRVCTGLQRIVRKLNSKGAFYVDEHGNVRRVGQSVFEPGEHDFNKAEERRVEEGRLRLEVFYATWDDSADGSGGGRGLSGGADDEDEDEMDEEDEEVDAGLVNLEDRLDEIQTGHEDGADQGDGDGEGAGDGGAGEVRGAARAEGDGAGNGAPGSARRKSWLGGFLGGKKDSRDEEADTAAPATARPHTQFYDAAGLAGEAVTGDDLDEESDFNSDQESDALSSSSEDSSEESSSEEDEDEDEDDDEDEDGDGDEGEYDDEYDEEVDEEDYAPTASSAAYEDTGVIGADYGVTPNTVAQRTVGGTATDPSQSDAWEGEGDEDEDGEEYDEDEDYDEEEYDDDEDYEESER